MASQEIWDRVLISIAMAGVLLILDITFRPARPSNRPKPGLCHGLLFRKGQLYVGLRWTFVAMLAISCLSCVPGYPRH